MAGARRIFADLEEFRDLGEGEPFVEPQDDHLALPVGEPPEGVAQSRHFVGQLDGVAGRGGRELLGCVTPVIESSRPQAAPGASHGDLQEPGAERLRRPQLRQRPVALQERLLEEVVRVARADQPLAEAEEPALVAVDQPLERRRLARKERPDVGRIERGVRGLCRDGHREDHSSASESHQPARVKNAGEPPRAPGGARGGERKLDATTEGLVVRIDRKQLLVEIGERVVPCGVRGRFFEGQDDDPESRPVAVGDRVRVQLDGEGGVIEEVLPRRNRIARPKPRDPASWQVIAANLDLLVIVASLRQPATRPGMIDRMLVAAEAEGIAPLVVLNKADLAEPAEIDAVAEPYRAIGYQVLSTSVPDGRGIDALRAAMVGRVAMLIGHSGVGKSSLLAALDPSVAARIGELVAQGTKMARGAHTTTSASLHRLAFGGHVVDTPGVREFGLPPMEAHDLAHWFREFAPLLSGCRYSTCTHDHEPACAIKAAVESGAIRRERYVTYQKLLAELRGGGQRMQRHDAY